MNISTSQTVRVVNHLHKDVVQRFGIVNEQGTLLVAGIKVNMEGRRRLKCPSYYLEKAKGSRNSSI
jgi:hypothetical protein